jgi:AraC-like DNA-binding protein
MAARLERVLHQSFLPAGGSARAFVWKHSPLHGGRRPRHFHIEPELNLVVSGWAEFGVAEGVVRVSEGELLGFPAGQDHVLLRASPDLYLYAIGMEPLLSSEALRGNAGSDSVPFHVRLTTHDLESVSDRASGIVDQTGIEQHCAELWDQAHWLARRRPGGAKKTAHVLTARAARVLSESPELGLESLARRLRANPCEVSRHFHRDMGMTLVQYRARLRLLRFLRGVDEGQGNWTELATAVGFGSYSQCHRVFHAELGCAPREFLLSGLRNEMQQIYES